MNFKYYCIVVMGETEGVMLEIDKVSESIPRVLKSEGILITTFKSAANANEIEDYLTSLNRNFFIFEIGADNTGYNIINKLISKDLFSHVELYPEGDLSKLESEINGNDIEFKPESMSYKDRVDYITNLLDEEGYDYLTTEDKRFYIDICKGGPKLIEGQEKTVIEQIIDKGYENLSDEDKELLKILSKSK